MKLLYAPYFDLYKARKIKGHYRHLKNGKIVYIDEHLDKRKEAKKDPEKYRQRVIYADDKSTHIMNADGTVTQHPHDESKVLSDSDKVSRMGHSIPIDKDLATEMFRKKHWLEDPKRWKEFQNKIKENAKEKGIEGKKGEVSDQLKKEHKKLTEAYGERISRANAYLHGNRQLRDHLEERGETNDYDAAEHRLATENAEGFQEYLNRFKKQVKLADTKTASDCPTIVGLSPGIQFYGHQAEALARLNVLDKAIVDVDMGGGKGLLLPADAMNLMAQGKVKKPLIVVPTNTLEQNAKLTVEAYTEGRVNVFKIDNATLKKQFGNDLDTLCKAIDEAPPNTIFMVGYDFVAANHGADPDDMSTNYKNAQRLSGVGFDYVALDEAHRIKNVQTSRWEATQLLANAPYKRVASGTFISNNPADCLGQIAFLHPHVAMTEKDFKIKYGYVKTASNKDKKVAGVTKWSKEGTKRLREDLKDYGMISIRRSAWINKLPQRNEALSVCKPSDKLRKAYDDALEDTIRSMQEEDGFDELDDMVGADEDMKGAMVMKLNALQAISDYPDTIATMIDDAVDKMGGKRAANRAVKGDDDIDAELEETIEFLKRFTPATRNALSGLKGTVSPKALDVYKKMEEHFKDPKNGKFIIFCQRKLSAQHILDHMPEHLKEKALYYDANKKAELKEWATDPKGPQILVAVDLSITEGVNLQIANGMYRYDHHYSPGTQEQSYARIWRPGQQKPVKIHLGVVDDTMDVTKVARMISKLHTNMMVTSDMDDDDTFEAYTLNIENIRNNRNAHILPEYLDMGKKILDFQRDEGKDYDKRYKGEKDGKYPRGSAAPLGGTAAKDMHGLPGYQEYAGGVVGSGFIDDDAKDKLLGHYRDFVRTKIGKEKKHKAYDRDLESQVMPHVIALAERHAASPSKDSEVTPQLFNAYKNEYKKDNGDELSPNVQNALKHAVDSWATKKKHSSHTSDGDHEGALTVMDEKLKLKLKPQDKKAGVENLKALLAHLGNKTLKHLGNGEVENPEIAEKFWKQLEAKKGYDIPDKSKDALLGAAALIHENRKGYQGIKHYLEDEE